MNKNKDDTILFDRIKFLEMENARLDAQLKQRRPIFGKEFLSIETREVLVFIVVIVACVLLIAGSLNWITSDNFHLKCDQEKTASFMIECSKANTMSSCRITAKDMLCEKVLIK